MSVNPVVGLCRLCHKRHPLVESHVVPRFVYTDLKRRYKTPTLIRRGADKSLDIVQDGPRQPLMCADCDRSLGKVERLFAEQFYRPFIKGRVPISYGSWLARFCAITSWRVLLELRLKGGPPNYSERAIHQAEQALSVWRAFILEEPSDVGAFQFHILPLNQGPTYDEWMIAGAVGNSAYYYEPDESAFVISKLGPLVVVGTVNDPNGSVWTGTHVETDGGRFGDDDTFRIPESLRGYFERWQQEIGARIDVTTVKAERSKSQRTHGGAHPRSVLDAPDFTIDVRYLGPQQHPLKLAVTMQPIDESWQPFFAAMPTDLWRAANPSLRIGSGDREPWLLPSVDTNVSIEGGWTIVRTNHPVGAPEAAFLLVDKIPNLLLFGAAGAPKRVLLGPPPKDVPPLPEWLQLPLLNNRSTRTG